MDETQFEHFIEEFKDLRDDIHLDMARIGLARIRESKQQEGGQQERESRGRPDAAFRQPDLSFMEIAPHQMDTLLGELKSNVYTVQIFEPMRTLVMPMFHLLEGLQLEEQAAANQRHHESVIQMGQLMNTIQESSSRFQFTFLESMQFQYRMFMRHPIWNSITRLLDPTKSPVFRTLTGLLFGFKEEKSVDEKILDAIKQQTEFLRTGEIGPSRGALGRFFQQGAIRSILGGVLNAYTGIGRGAAQEREDQRARGEDVAGGLRGLLTDRMFGGSPDIVRRGRASGMATREATEATEAETLLEGIERVTQKQTDSIVDTILHLTQTNIELASLTHSTQSGIQSDVERGINTLSMDMAAGSDVVREQVEASNNVVSFMGKEMKDSARMQREGSQKVEQEVSALNDIVARHRRQQEEIEQERAEREEGYLEEISGNTKRTFKEVKQGRIVALFGQIAATLVTTATTISAAIANIGTNIVTSLLSGKGLAALAGAIATAVAGAIKKWIPGFGGDVEPKPGGAGKPGDTTRKPGTPPEKKAGTPPEAEKEGKNKSRPKVRSKIGIGRGLGALGLGIGALQAGKTLADEELTGKEKLRDILGLVGGGIGGVAGGLSGGAIGTAVAPGVGTAVGATAGGVAGYGIGENAVLAAFDRIDEYLSPMERSMREVRDEIKAENDAQARREGPTASTAPDMAGRRPNADVPLTRDQRRGENPLPAQSSQAPQPLFDFKAMEGILPVVQPRPEDGTFVTQMKTQHEEELGALEKIEKTMHDLINVMKQSLTGEEQPPDNARRMDEMLTSLRGFS